MVSNWESQLPICNKGPLGYFSTYIMRANIHACPHAWAGAPSGMVVVIVDVMAVVADMQRSGGSGSFMLDRRRNRGLDRDGGGEVCDVFFSVFFFFFWCDGNQAPEGLLRHGCLASDERKRRSAVSSFVRRGLKGGSGGEGMTRGGEAVGEAGGCECSRGFAAQMFGIRRFYG